MLPPAQRRHLEELNTDHHRRMELNFKCLERGGKLSRVLAHDDKSRRNIVDAMIGCSSRCVMGKDPETETIVLELGAGSGRDIDHLREVFAAEYFGVEVVERAASDLAGRNVHYLALEEMPADWNGRFNFIYSRHVMEHVIDVDVALSTLKRVLAPNGIIGAVTPHIFPDPEPAHVTQLRAEEWTAAYAKHGLRVVYSPVLNLPACVELHLVAIHIEWPWPPAC